MTDRKTIFLWLISDYSCRFNNFYKWPIDKIYSLFLYFIKKTLLIAANVQFFMVNAIQFPYKLTVLISKTHFRTVKYLRKWTQCHYSAIG